MPEQYGMIWGGDGLLTWTSRDNPDNHKRLPATNRQTSSPTVRAFPAAEKTVYKVETSSSTKSGYMTNGS